MKKLLVIFFLAVIPILLIYINAQKREENIYLAIGDALALGKTPFNSYGKSYVDFYYNHYCIVKRNCKLNTSYINEDIRIKDLLNEIESESPTNLSQAIKEANLITISIGSEELFSKIRSNNMKVDNLNEFIDILFYDMDALIKQIRKLTKSEIYLIGYYNIVPLTAINQKNIDDFYNKIDQEFKKLEDKYNIRYVEIYSKFKEKSKFLPLINNAFPSLDGYKLISEEIIKKES